MYQYQDKYGDRVMRKIRWHLFRYEGMKRAIKWARLEQSSRNARPEIHAEGFVSNPTAAEAIRNLTPLKSVTVGHDIVYNPETWVSVIDSVYDKLDGCDRRIVTDTFIKGNRWEKVIADNHIDKNAYYRRRDRIVSLIAIKAACAGIVKLD